MVFSLDDLLYKVPYRKAYSVCSVQIVSVKDLSDIKTRR